MPRRNDLESICIVGSGPIVIGQAAEFDYAGCQALKVLREDGFRTIVVNSNPATIMTDPGFADRTYIEPLDAESVAEVLRLERPDALLPTMGGQTALNLARELANEGVLDELGIELIGARLDAIERAEDRLKFKEAVESCGLKVPRSAIVTSLDELDGLMVPAVVRPAFTLGGHGGGFAYTAEELYRQVERGLSESPIGQVLVEESVRGWDEFELEVVRDRIDNVVIVCSIENLDPMGVHTGDSVTVAPQMTLPDEAYQELRDAAAAVIRAVGVDTGGSNIQFARSRETGDVRVIEMNPRVSRSSALASKATGYPIAKVAARLAVGYTLDEIPNDLTGTTPASFEPTLDYVVVKFPRFAFEKFPGADRTLGTQMKSVGETMGIGRTFAEAFLKAYRSRELDPGAATPWQQLASDVPDDVHPFFQREFAVIGEALAGIGDVETLVAGDWLRLKRLGLSDAEIAAAAGTTETAARQRRRDCGVRPAYRRVDSCAGEVEAASNYYYSTWGEADEAPPTGERPRVVILGSGPNRIGQGIEFDYCCVHAVTTYRELGYEAVMVNCNPETVSTDYDTSDRLYFEPLDTESVLAICEREKPDGVVIQFGGQTPLKLARAIEEAGYRILGTPFDAVDLAEDRERFAGLLLAHGLRSPEWGIAASPDEAVEIAERIGYPVLVRPSYVLGGRAMRVCYTPDEVREMPAFERILVDRFVEHAVEVDVDALCDGSGHVRRGGHAARRGGRRPLGRLGLRPARAEPLVRAEPGDRADRADPRARAWGRRAPQRPARGHGRRRRVRDRGEPARVTDGALREQGHRTRARQGGVPPRARGDHRGARAAVRAAAAAVERQGRGAAVRALPRQRSGAGAGDALDRRGDGERRRPLDRARQGRARGRTAAAAFRLRLHLHPRARPSAGGADRGHARRPRLRALRDGGDRRHARGRGDRGRAGAEAERGNRRRADGRRPDPPRPLRPRDQYAGGPQRPLGRLRDPRGRAHEARAVHHDAVGRRRRGARDRDGAGGAGHVSSGADRCRARRLPVGIGSPPSERIGPYTLLRVERGDLEPGVPGQFFMLEAPGRLLPRPFSLCLAPPGELAFLVDPIGPGTEALCRLRAGDEIGVLGPLGHGYRLDVERPLLVGGGIGIAPLPYLAEQLGGSPPAVLGFRSAEHAEAAVLVPGAEVVIDPVLVTELIEPGFDVLACGPEPMLHAVAALCPTAQLAWEAPMACGYGACYGCVVEIDGALKRLCLEGPVLDAARVRTHEEAVA